MSDNDSDHGRHNDGGDGGDDGGRTPPPQNDGTNEPKETSTTSGNGDRSKRESKGGSGSSSRSRRGGRSRKERSSRGDDERDRDGGGRRRRGGSSRSGGGGGGSGGMEDYGGKYDYYDDGDLTLDRANMGTAFYRKPSTAQTAASHIGIPGYRSSYVLGTDFRDLLDEVRQNAITSVRLFDNESGTIGDEEIYALAKALLRNDSIRVVTIRGTTARSESFAALVRSLEQHPRILSVDIGDNPIDDEPVGIELEYLAKNNPRIIDIDVSDSFISEEMSLKLQALCEENQQHLSEPYLLLEGSAGAASLPAICIYFKAGVCQFGPMCKNLHIEGDPEWAANRPMIEQGSLMVPEVPTRPLPPPLTTPPAATTSTTANPTPAPTTRQVVYVNPNFNPSNHFSATGGATGGGGGTGGPKKGKKKKSSSLLDNDWVYVGLMVVSIGLCGRVLFQTMRA